MNKKQVDELKDELLSSAIDKSVDEIFNWVNDYLPNYVPATPKNVSRYKIEDTREFAYCVKEYHIKIKGLKILSKEYHDHDFDIITKRLKALKPVAEEKISKWFEDAKTRMKDDIKESFIKEFGGYYKSIK